MSDLATTTLRSYTSQPNDSDPNTGAIEPDAATVFIVPVNAPDSSMARDRGFKLYLEHDATGGELSGTITPWAWDSTTSKWVALAPITGVVRRTLYEGNRIGGDRLWFQTVLGAGPTFDADHPVSIQVRSY